MKDSDADESISIEIPLISIMALELGAKVAQLAQFSRATSEVVGIICDGEGADGIARGTISGSACSKTFSLSWRLQ